MTRADIYAHDELTPLLAPRSVAIVGASSRPGSFGQRTLKNLRAHFDGPVWLVNPQYESLGDDRCWPSVAALPQVPDCAVIAVPRERVQALVAECVAAGVPGVLVFASGYAETDLPERLDEQRALAELVRGTGTRLLGPNCLGFANFTDGRHLSFSEFPPGKGGACAVGVVSQSGALAMAIAQGAEVGAPISHALACGNMIDVDAADLVGWLAGEPGCAAIVMILEGHDRPARVEAAGRVALAAGKALIVHKLGRSATGRHSAWRHTASIAGSHDEWQAVFERCGAVVVDDFDRVLEVAAFFAKAPRSRGRGAAIVSSSGGACIIAADAAAAHGVDLPQAADPAHAATLAAAIPAFGYPLNPYDLTAQAISDPQSFRTCIGTLMADDAYDAVVLPLVQAYESATPRIDALDEAGRANGRIGCTVWLSQWMGGPGYAKAAASSNVALFRSLDNCFWTLARWQARQRWLEQRRDGA